MIHDSVRRSRLRALVRPIRRGFGAYLLLIVLVISALWFLALVSQLVR
jgi:hypothetical protein